jgi:type II secretory pathway pseudopilin PulG
VNLGSPPPQSSPTFLNAARRRIADERGIGLVEMVVACAIIVILSSAVAGVLTSSIAATAIASDRTKAEECASDQVEQIRRRPYDSVGTVGGNPSGTVPPTAACGSGFHATATVSISYKNDPTPTSYATGANYKKVTVTVQRDRDGKVLTTVVTFVAPSSRAPYGGINNAIINATVVDLGTNLAYEGAIVHLSNGPSTNRTDTTDVTGAVSFAALTPNPTSGPQSYYDLTVDGGSGYQTLAADLPPGSATPPSTASHIQLSPSQTSTTSIRIFKPATIVVQLRDAGGAPYTGGATMEIDSSFTGSTSTDAVAAGTSSRSITSLAGQPVIPGATYTIRGYTTDGLCATPSPSPVPSSGYPAILSQTFTLTFTPCPTGTLVVNVKQFGLNAAGAAVSVTGGPNGISTSGTADANGNVSFTLPEGAGYTVTATKIGQSASVSPAVTAGSTASASMTLPNGPMKTVTITVRDGTLAAYKNKPVMVSVTGGPLGSAGSAPALTTSPSPVTTTNVNPATVSVSVPQVAGYTYTVKVSVSPCITGTNRQGVSSLSSAAGATAVTVNLTGSLTCPYTP